MITDAQSVKFCNQVLRPACDQLAGAMLLIQQTLNAWTAKQLGSSITATDDLIDDGAASGGLAPGSPDGRTPISGNDVNACIANMQTLLTAAAANGNAMALNVMKIAVNPVQQLT